MCEANKSIDNKVNHRTSISFSDDFEVIEISLDDRKFSELKEEKLFDEVVECDIEIVNYAIGGESGTHDYLYCYFKRADDAYHRLVFKENDHNLKSNDGLLSLQDKKVRVRFLHGKTCYEKSGKIIIDTWTPPSLR